MTDLHDLELLLRSDTPVLLIETLEEPRLIKVIAQGYGELPRALIFVGHALDIPSELRR
jgi:hypothetical protein